MTGCETEYVDEAWTYALRVELAPDPTVAATDFRKALGNFCSGITVVASMQDSGPVGLTCQSFFSLSLEPRLVALAVSKTSSSFALVRQQSVFSINVLAHDQQEVSNALARSGADKWAGVRSHPGRFGQPIIAGAVASFECRFTAVHDAGDHHLVVAEVLDLSYDEQSQPLLYFRGSYRGVADATDAGRPLTGSRP